MKLIRNILLVTAFAAMLSTPVVGDTMDKSGLTVLNQSVSVCDAVNIALANSPNISSRRAAIRAAQARVGMARAMARPQVSTTTFATGGSMEMIVPGSEGVKPQNLALSPREARLDQNLMAMYPLYTGGAIRNKVGSANALQVASEWDAATSELDVALVVKSAYYQALYQRQVVTAYQQRVCEATERLRIARESFDAGRIAKFDLLRNQTDLAEAQQELNNAERDEAGAIIDLKNAMGISQSSKLTLSDALAYQDHSPTLDDLLATAVSKRPEVAAARARTKSAEASMSAAKGAYLPQVYATAMAEGFSTHNVGTDGGYLVGITAALPILDGGLRRSSVSEAAAMLDQMKSDEREAVLMVSRDVASSLNQLCAAVRNVKLSESAVSQSEEDYRVIKLRYEAGKATNVEVLDALAALTRAQTNRAEALYNYSVAHETLVRATGQR